MKKTKPLLKRVRKTLLRHIKSILILGVAGIFVVLGIIALVVAFIKLPDFNTFHDRKIVESTKIYDHTGEILLYSVHDDIKRTLVPLEDISDDLKKLVVVVEDASFYEHHGIRIQSTIRAILANLLGRGYQQGGSTITQQVIKKTLLVDQKTATRKIKEWILSIKLEQVFSKDEILELYLNEIPYGGNVYGIGEATRLFFNIEPKDITLAQSAYLAAIPNAPTRYSPYGNNREALENRKNFILKRALTLGFITEEEYNQALAEVVEFLPRSSEGIKAPHFVMLVREYLANKYGEQAVEENGYKVITTLNYELQEQAEKIAKESGADIEARFSAGNMGIVAVDPRNGHILAMVGSRDYFDIEREGNFNVTTAPNRQPGSTLKPFVYASLFMKGYTPETVLFDLPTNFSTNCDPYGNPLVAGMYETDCYMPQNYDGAYRGPISVRDALAQSLNIPAVKALYLTGMQDALKTMRDVGITSLNNPARYGLTLVLGGGEVSLLELTSAYGVLANEGVRHTPVSILRVEDKQGNIIEEFSSKPEEVIPREVARQITNILSDNIARTPAFGPNSPLFFSQNDVAVKTGTTNDYHDVWTIGYTPTIALGIWAGNNNNKPINKNVAGMVIAPIWRSAMNEALAIIPSPLFTKPNSTQNFDLPAPLQGIWQGGEKYIIDTSTGSLANESTLESMKQVIVVPEVHSILYWVDKRNPLGPQPQNPLNDPQFTLWETPIRAWVESQNITEGDRSNIPPEDTSSFILQGGSDSFQGIIQIPTIQ